jgi:hypothetical protein
MTVETKLKKEDWMQSRWRPMMAVLYMMVCAFDFMVAPVLWSVIQAMYKGQITTQWQPLTLQGAGLFHLAMGAVLGVAAYGRTQEKLNNVAGSNFGPSTDAMSQPTYSPAAPMPSRQIFTNITGKSGPVAPPDQVL